MSKKYISIRPCPVCKRKEGIMLTQLCYALFDDLEISGNKTLVQCRTCAMLYDDVDFSENQLNKYYYSNEHYAASRMGGTGVVSVDSISRYDRIIDCLVPDLKGGVILDFGCGQGGFISQCLKYGFKAVGIESSLKSREVAREAGLHVYESISKFVEKNPSCEIQAIVFSHVLEHLMNPLELLQVFAKYTKDALVYIEVPDADSYLSPNAVRWQEMHFEHLSHFRKKNIEDLAKCTGIEILKEGEIHFSEMQKDIRCRFILGRFSVSSPVKERSRMMQFYPVLQSPTSLSIRTLLHAGRPLALWGVSQYAMLLLGSLPELIGRIRRLFDASPAKIGRKIRGITIEPSNNLLFLTDDYILLIPRSNYLSQMHSQLSDIDFKGLAIDI